MESHGTSGAFVPSLDPVAQTDEQGSACVMTTAVVHVERKILLLRGERVMLDADLAALYGVATRSLIQAVKRNVERFPDDFMFQLTAAEARVLRSQYGADATSDQ